MSKKRDRLNDCLARLLQGEEMESCLKDYPEEAEQLRPLLKTAGGIRRYAETIELRPEFVARTQASLVRAYDSKYFSSKARIAGILKPVGRLAAVAVIVLVALVGAFTGGLTLSVLASEDTMPGETLYPVKLATEQIRLTLAFSDDRKVSYLTQFAEARVEEIVYAYGREDADQVEATLERLEGHLASVEDIVAPGRTPTVIAEEHDSPELQEIESAVKGSAARVAAKLEKIKEINPEKKDKINDRVDTAYSKAIKAIQDQAAK